MEELRKRAARALLALLQNDAETAKEQLNVYRITHQDGEPTLVGDVYPIRDSGGPAFGYPCQEECGEARGTVRAKVIGVCDQCHAQHFSAREEKRYQEAIQEGQKET